MTSIGQPVSRYDGRLKVTGAAAYTADIFLPGAMHGAIGHSTIANGRAESIDTAVAERAPGVVAVFTHRNMPRMKPTAPAASPAPTTSAALSPMRRKTGNIHAVLRHS